MAIKPSRCLAMWLVLSHVLAAVVGYMTVMPPAAGLMLFVLILLSLSYYLARDVWLLLPSSWCAVSLERDGLSVATRGGSSLSGHVARPTTVNSWFIVLCLRSEGGLFPVFRTFFPDALAAGEFRELCVRLRFQ